MPPIIIKSNTWNSYSYLIYKCFPYGSLGKFLDRAHTDRHELSGETCRYLCFKLVKALNFIHNECSILRLLQYCETFPYGPPYINIVLRTNLLKCYICICNNWSLLTHTLDNHAYNVFKLINLFNQIKLLEAEPGRYCYRYTVLLGHYENGKHIPGLKELNSPDCSGCVPWQWFTRPTLPLLIYDKHNPLLYTTKLSFTPPTSIRLYLWFTLPMLLLPSYDSLDPLYVLIPSYDSLDPFYFPDKIPSTHSTAPQLWFTRPTILLPS